MKTEIVKITPGRAAEILNRHEKKIEAGEFRQRPIRDRLVNRFAQDMLHGDWKLSHQGIAFDVDDNLLDGQHRLRAVCKANLPVEMMVTTELPKNGLLDVLDSGASRSVAQQLHLGHGYANSVTVAAITRCVGQVVMDDPKLNLQKWVTLSASDSVWMLDKLDFKTPIDRAFTLVLTPRLRTAQWIAPWLFYWRVYPRKAEAFARNLQQLSGLTAGDPALQLNQYLMSTVKRPRRSHSFLMRVSASCMQAHDENKPLRNIDLRPLKSAHEWLLDLDGGKLAKSVLTRLSNPAKTD